MDQHVASILVHDVGSIAREASAATAASFLRIILPQLHETIYADLPQAFLRSS